MIFKITDAHDACFKSFFSQENGYRLNICRNIASGDDQLTVRGFRPVDTEKLGELDNETPGDRVKRGVMGLVQAHLHFLDNICRKVV